MAALKTEMSVRLYFLSICFVAAIVVVVAVLLFWGVSMLACIYSFVHISILLISNCAETFYLNEQIYCHSLKLCLQFPVSTTTVTMAPPSVCRPSVCFLWHTTDLFLGHPFPDHFYSLVPGCWQQDTLCGSSQLVTSSVLGCFLQQGCQGLVHMPSVQFSLMFSHLTNLATFW